MGLFDPIDLKVPASRDAIAGIQSERKPIAIERAKRATYYQGKLDHLDVTRLDDPEEWAKVPIIDKEELRRIGLEAFNKNFLICEPGDVSEFCRSGGATGVPLFYPRTQEDIEWAFIHLCRCWALAGAGKEDVVHMSFPLGVHPAGHLWARSAYHMGTGVMWAGSGANTPSQTQLELINLQQPTMWMGMPSYGLHLANMAAAQGIDLASSRVRKVLVGAEALSDAKREKLERMWGADVHDLFGMTEVGIPGGDSIHHEGFHIWTDQFLFEVVDEDTRLPVPDGTPGLMLITPLFTNNATPFLRWSSGDIVTITHEHSLDGPFGVFPVMRHAHRTAGFWKVRGMNINHAEMEDLVFRVPAVNDFRVEARTGDALEHVWVGIEVSADVEGAQVAGELGQQIKAVFEVTAEIEVLETGTLAAEFETTVKAARFVDQRV
jgi:phenylacetate-CoA ligase